MKQKVLLLAALSFNLVITGSVLAQNRNSSSGVECLEQNSASNSKSPFDLWKSISTCVAEDKYEQAVFMFGLAGSQGVFDSMRVVDPSARQAAKVLPMGGMASMEKEKSKTFQQKVQEHFGDVSKRAALCGIYKGMLPPSYFPSYMVNHGLASMSGKTTDPLAAGFNAADAWPKSVDIYMQCPKG